MTPSPPSGRFLPKPIETTITAHRPKLPATPHESESTSAQSPGEHTASQAVAGKAMDTVQQQPRKFKVEPIESSKSSRRKVAEHVEHVAGLTQEGTGREQVDEVSGEQNAAQRSAETKPRKFAPVAVESSARSSKDKKEQQSKPRRFAAEPIESSTRSSKSKRETEQKPRRFAPEIVETSSKTRRGAKDDNDQKSEPKPRRKFAPEPISTEKMSRRRISPDTEDSTANTVAQPLSARSSQSSDTPRRFSPELYEVVRGSFRQVRASSPAKPAPTSTIPEEKEEESESEDEVPSLPESKFSAASLAKRQREQERRRSFAVPDLPIIESDSGDDSSAPSLTNSHSSAESDQNKKPRHRPGGAGHPAYPIRPVKDHKDLDAMAMAAYINYTPHHAPAHYGFSDDDDETASRARNFSGEDGADIRLFRRQSQDDHDWEMQEMRRHHAQLEEAKRQFKHDTAGQSRF